MLSASSRSACRAVARRRTALHVAKRFESSQAGGGSTGSSASAHVVSGLVGGGIVVLAGYTYYHFSGLKSIVQTSQQMKSSVIQAGQSVKENAPEALRYLRSVAQSYASLIPGGSTYVNTTFDALDHVAENNREEFNRIVARTVDEIQAVTKSGKADLKTAQAVFEILRKRMGELTALGGKASSDLLEKNPEIKKKFEELRRLAESQVGGSSELQKRYDELKSSVNDIFKDGFNPDALARAKELLASKGKELYELANEEKRKVWDKALEQAGPALSKLPPDIKSTLESNAGVLAGGAGVSDLFRRITELGKEKGGASKEKIAELKKAIEQKVQDASDSEWIDDDHWEYLLQFVRSVPYGDKLVDQSPFVSDFVKIARDESDEAKRLAKATYQDVMKVLEKRGEEAQKLAAKTKDKAEKKSSSS